MDSSINLLPICQPSKLTLSFFAELSETKKIVADDANEPAANCLFSHGFYLNPGCPRGGLSRSTFSQTVAMNLCKASALGEAHSGGLASPRAISTGIPALDYLLGQTGGERCGLEEGSITEVFGPSLSGKSFILQRVVATIVERMLRSHAHFLAAPACSSSALDWKVYVCLFGEIMPSNAAHANSYYCSGWKSLLSRIGRDCSRPEQKDYLDTHVHVIDFDEPNGLLDFLATISEACREERGERCSNDHQWAHTLLVVDSLSYLWSHPALGGLGSRRWFSMELCRVLRKCVMMGSSSRGSLACSRMTTVVVANGVRKYGVQDVPNCLIYPAGDTAWLRAADCRLYVEPACPLQNSVPREVISESGMSRGTEGRRFSKVSLMKSLVMRRGPLQQTFIPHSEIFAPRDADTTYSSKGP